MLYLKPINLEDWEEEYKANRMTPPMENGLENRDYDTSPEEFRGRVIPERMSQAQGENLPEGYVPCTTFYLWDDNHIVGRFKIRHYLNDALKVRGGHIGYNVLEPYRGKGFGTEGLRLAIEEARKLIKEDYILMSVLKTNTASLDVMTNNGARIVEDKGDYYLTRIDL